MAVKCDIPNLALKSLHSVLYGFSCENVTKKIVQNYLEYLKCSEIDYSFCEDFPCEQSGGDVTCDISGVNVEVEYLNTTATIAFNIPSQPYVIVVINVDANITIYDVITPTSPINLTGLIPDTDYLVKLILNCEGGETKQVEVPFHTLPNCVIITDFVGTTEVTP